MVSIRCSFLLVQTAVWSTSILMIMAQLLPNRYAQTCTRKPWSRTTISISNLDRSSSSSNRMKTKVWAAVIRSSSSISFTRMTSSTMSSYHSILKLSFSAVSNSAWASLWASRATKKSLQSKCKSWATTTSQISSSMTIHLCSTLSKR